MVEVTTTFSDEAIVNWLEKNLEGCENPREHGKALSGEWNRHWRYRGGDYRIIAKILDDKVIKCAVSLRPLGLGI